MRTFFAIDFDRDVRNEIEHEVSRLKKQLDVLPVRWLPPSSLHMTVSFLGDVKIENVDEIVHHVKMALQDVTQFDFDLNLLKYFPSKHHPRIIALLPSFELPLIDLARTVDQGVTTAGFPTEQRTFKPHLSIGRIRNTNMHLPTLPLISSVSSIKVEKLTFFSSMGNSQYKILATIPLKQAFGS